jgi:pimeloyl-ACP methyl ester carboxylesterase
MPPNRVQKNPWLLLRGLSRESAHWGEFPAMLQTALGIEQVKCLDLPGNGERHSETTPLTLNGLMESVRADWHSKRDQRDSRIFIFALSLGAMVALEWMHTHPGEVEGAVLVNTSLRGVSPFYKRLSPANYLRIAKVLLESDVAAREKRILEMTSQKPKWGSEEVMRRVAIQVLHPVSKANALRQVVAALSSAKGFYPPKQPVLLLNSLGDHLVHPDCSAALAEKWKLPLRRHAWAGHDLPLDDPQWVVQAVLEWLESQNERSILTKSK